MNRHDHPRPTGARRPARRLILFTLALTLALAGCAGGGGGTDGGIQIGSPEVGVPAPPADSGSGASGSGASGSGASGSGQAGSGGGPVVTAPSDPAAPPTAPGDGPVDIEVGGPSLSIPAGPPPAPPQSFGEVATGAESAPRRFRLRSGSGDAVEVLALTVNGDGGFSLTDNQCTGTTLPPGGSGGCAFAVVFRPHQEGAATGELLVRLAQTGGGQVATGTGAPLATGRVALASVTERTLARLVGHGTTAAQ
jgi:hypothetical protein